MTELPGVGQPADAGERDEHEPERQAGRAPAPAASGRASSGDELRALRNPHPTAGADQVGRVLPVGGQRGEARHGRDQARARHRAAGEGGDRGTTRVRRPAGRAESSAKAALTRAGSAGVFPGDRNQAAWCGMFRSTRAPAAEARLAGTGHWQGPARLQGVLRTSSTHLSSGSRRELRQKHPPSNPQSMITAKNSISGQ